MKTTFIAFPNPRILAYIAMADAYAMSCEYLKPDETDTLRQALEFSGYVRHPRHQEGAGIYTDDTEMSLANTHVLLDRSSPSTLDFANAYVNEFQRGGRRKGYSRGLYSILCSVTTGKELMTRLGADSTKNGAAMRAVPLGVIPNIGQLLELARAQALVTHNSDAGVFSAQAVALMAHFALHDPRSLGDIPAECPRELPKVYAQRFARVFKEPWPSNRPIMQREGHTLAEDTVQAVVTAVTTKTTLMSMLEWIIRCGGDTDTVAAISWGIASCRYIDEKLPEFFARDLECGNPNTGFPHLCEVSRQLMGLCDPRFR